MGEGEGLRGGGGGGGRGVGEGLRGRKGEGLRGGGGGRGVGRGGEGLRGGRGEGGRGVGWGRLREGEVEWRRVCWANCKWIGQVRCVPPLLPLGWLSSSWLATIVPLILTCL